MTRRPLCCGRYRHEAASKRANCLTTPLTCYQCSPAPCIKRQARYSGKPRRYRNGTRCPAASPQYSTCRRPVRRPAPSMPLPRCRAFRALLSPDGVAGRRSQYFQNASRQHRQMPGAPTMQIAKILLGDDTMTNINFSRMISAAAYTL